MSENARILHDLDTDQAVVLDVTVTLRVALDDAAIRMADTDLAQAIERDLKHQSPVNAPDAWAEVIGVDVQHLGPRTLIGGDTT